MSDDKWLIGIDDSDNYIGYLCNEKQFYIFNGKWYGYLSVDGRWNAGGYHNFDVTHVWEGMRRVSKEEFDNYLLDKAPYCKEVYDEIVNNKFREVVDESN